MWPYWFLFLLPALFALVSQRRAIPTSTRLYSVRLDGIWIAAILFLSLMIGYRLEVGGDWGAYLRYLYRVQGAEIGYVLTMNDPGYQVINWVSDNLGWGIWGVNLISALVFSTGLVVFCRSLPRPWLAIAVAVPYLITIVGMGYTRQSIALGFAMLGLVSLGRKNTLWFVVWILLGATCHKSAVLLLPIAALATTRNKYWTAIWVGIVSIAAYLLLLEEAVEHLYAGYIESEYQSQGAFVRLAMNVVPALMLLLWGKRFSFSEGEAPLWRWFALISLALFAILLVTPATTAVDRVALYMLPLQLVVFSHLPDLLGRKPGSQSLLAIAVIAYYALVYFVWLNYATHAHAWLPYRNYLFE